MTQPVGRSRGWRRRWRATPAALLDRATNDRETIIIACRGRPDGATIAANELESLQVNMHRRCSPSNAVRLLVALERSERGEGIRMSPDELRVELGLVERSVANPPQEGASIIGGQLKPSCRIAGSAALICPHRAR